MAGPVRCGSQLKHRCSRMCGKSTMNLVPAPYCAHGIELFFVRTPLQCASPSVVARLHRKTEGPSAKWKKEAFGARSSRCWRGRLRKMDTSRSKPTTRETSQTPLLSPLVWLLTGEIPTNHL